MKNYKTLFLCVSIVLVTILLLFGFLVIRRVGTTQENYFFQRYFSDNSISWKLQEVPRIDTLEVSQGSYTNKIDSVMLDDSNCLAFGPKDTTKAADFTFFCYSIMDNQFKRFIINHADLACGYSNIYEKRLAYDGVFLRFSNYITYTFQHLPIIVVFDAKGNLLKQIHTKDNVPCPSIIRYKHLYIYERGKTFNSNISSFVNGQLLYVFSYRVPKISKEFVVDIYSLETGKYLYSAHIGSDKTSINTNMNIDKIFTDGKNIFIDTRSHLYKLIH